LIKFSYPFGDREAQTINESLDAHGDVNRQGTEREAVPCPVCDVQMRKKTYTANCLFQIDECEQHGVWLLAASLPLEVTVAKPSGT
jgi:hypothetical protein